MKFIEYIKWLTANIKYPENKGYTTHYLLKIGRLGLMLSWETKVK